ncbi:MAG: hypothetical protein KDK56_08170 [Simkania sp.]|nr:hypothetical protein [Simkania sp.]MCB1076032.1 hypothetical protein [Simkania sp.]
MSVLRLKIGIVMALLASPFYLWGMPKEFYGDAYDMKGKLLFREKHEVMFENDHVDKIRTTYYSVNDKLVGFLESYFHLNEFLPNMFFKRFSDNFIARCIVDPDHYVVLMRKSPHQDYYFEKTVKKTPDSVAGHGLYFFILNKLDEMLQQDVSCPVEILLPARLSTYACVMRATVDPDDNDVVTVAIKLKNEAKALFIKTILVKVNRKSHEFISYEGPNTLFYCEKLLCYIKINYHKDKE